MSDLLSSILGFLEAEFNWDMVLYPRRGARRRRRRRRRRGRRRRCRRRLPAVPSGL